LETIDVDIIYNVGFLFIIYYLTSDS